MLTGGGGLFGISFVFFLIVHFFITPPNVSYLVEKEGIVLSAGKKQLKIIYPDIESVTHIKEKQTEEFILEFNLKTEEKLRKGIVADQLQKQGILQEMFAKIIEAFKEQTRAFAPYKFLSVPVIYKKSGGGSSLSSQKTTGVNLPCDTVFILLKNGEGYFVSPLNIEGFMSEVKKLINL